MKDMSPLAGCLGCLAFVVVFLFMRINRYERQVLIYHRRMNRLLDAVLSLQPPEKREEFLKNSGIDPEAWKEPLKL